MKKLAFLISLLIFNSVSASTIQQESIKTAAKNFLNLNLIFSKTEINIASISQIKITEDLRIYVCKLNPKGFLILSDKEELPPVIGYSFSNETLIIPEQLKELLINYRKLLKAGIIDEETLRRNRTSWNKLITGNIEFEGIENSVAPLLKTNWAQGEYYNNSCPEDTSSTADNNRVWTGCVATAMAQILRYNEHPINGVGFKSYNSISYGEISADFENHTYQWDLMPDTLNSNSTPEEINAVAELIYHCGVAVHMNYGSKESGASNTNVMPAFKNHFSYSSFIESATKQIDNSNNWFTIIKNQLDKNQPVYYGIRDDDNDLGHAFVCDGYDENKFIHCNWGWGGNYNGYYALDDLSPSGYNFDSGHFIVINLEPVSLITDNVNWYGDINLSQSIETLPDTYLNILPGTNIIVDSNKYILIRGKFSAEGIESDSIKFNAINGGNWKGLIVAPENGSTEDISFKYCSVRNASGKNRAVFEKKYNSGGAIYIYGDGKISIENCYFTANSSSTGGALAIQLNSSNSITISNCKFILNSAENGGSVALIAGSNSSSSILSKNYFYNNTSIRGGGVYTQNFTGTIYNNLFLNNSADYGGALNINGSSKIEVINNTLLNNRASARGEAISYSGLKNSLISNNIMWNDGYTNREFVIANDTSIVDIQFNCINRGLDGIYDNRNINYKLNKESNPNITINNGSYYLDDKSSAVNNGDPFITPPPDSTDFNSNSRIYGGRIDIGAVENQNQYAVPIFDLLKDSLNFHLFSTKSVSKEVDFYSWNNLDFSIELGDSEFPFGAELNSDTTKIIVSVSKTSPGIYSSILKVTSNLNVKYLYLTADIEKAIEGEVSGVWNDDTVHITGRAEVNEEDSLFIEPGTTILFHSYNPLVLSGYFNATGTEEQPIVFTSGVDSIPFRSLFFNNNEIGSKIEYSVFKNAGIIPNVTTGSVIDIINSKNIAIKNSQFIDAKLRKAISIYSSENIVIEKNYFGILYETESIILNKSKAVIENNKFINSGGVFSRESELSLINNIMIDVFGHILEISGTSPNLQNLIIGNAFINCWGGFNTLGSNFKFLNNIYINNRFGKYGSFISVEGNLHIGNGATVEFINCIFYNRGNLTNDSTFVFVEGTSQAFFSNCNIHGGIKSIISEFADLSNIKFRNNIFTNPLFVSENNLNLLETSPCIDAGTTEGIMEYLPETDLDGNPRIINGKIDIGAHEFQGTVSGIVEENNLPDKFRLFQNYPNPFNPTTTIEYQIPVGDANFESPASVKLIIFDVLGREVATLVDKQQKPGIYKIEFDGSHLSSGVYLYKLSAGKYHSTKKMLVIK